MAFLASWAVWLVAAVGGRISWGLNSFSVTNCIRWENIANRFKPYRRKPIWQADGDVKPTRPSKSIMTFNSMDGLTDKPLFRKANYFPLNTGVTQLTIWWRRVSGLGDSTVHRVRFDWWEMCGRVFLPQTSRVTGRTAASQGATSGGFWEKTTFEHGWNTSNVHFLNCVIVDLGRRWQKKRVNAFQKHWERVSLRCTDQLKDMHRQNAHTHTYTYTHSTHPGAPDSKTANADVLIFISDRHLVWQAAGHRIR